MRRLSVSSSSFAGLVRSSSPWALAASKKGSNGGGGSSNEEESPDWNSARNDDDDDDDSAMSEMEFNKNDFLVEEEDDAAADSAADNEEDGRNRNRKRKTNIDDFDFDEEDDDAMMMDSLDLDEEEDEEEDGYDVEDSDRKVRSSTTRSSSNKRNDGDDDGDAIDWDEDEDGGDYELQGDMDDPDFLQQKELVDAAVAASAQRVADENFDAFQFVLNDLTPAMAAELDELPFFQRVEEMSKNIIITEDDLTTIGNITDDNLLDEIERVSDLMEDDPYPRHDPGQVNYLERNVGITDDDMEELDSTYKRVQSVIKTEPWNKVMLKGIAGFDGLSNTTLAELDECLGEIGGSAYNVTNWLLYDLDFNVSNLILSAVKHNRNAPVLLQHWYPQLVTYERYQHARDRNYDFNWDDVENADLTELERYYAGFGYDEIPKKAPAETGIISLEDLDEEEIKMAAFESWMTDVYNPEADRKDFDDDLMRDEDNVFSEFFEDPQHPDLPPMDDVEDDLAQWREDIGDDPEARGYRDMMGRSFEYKVERDPEFEREFRGHLIIACTGEDHDLEIAEQITLRFEREFNKKVFVETRVMALAREEDNVYEIWLESYEIDLLHSKKRATSNAKGWTGPAEIDDAQIDYLTERVKFLISDDARYSYRLEMDMAEQ